MTPRKRQEQTKVDLLPLRISLRLCILDAGRWRPLTHQPTMALGGRGRAGKHDEDEEHLMTFYEFPASMQEMFSPPH